MYVEKIGQLLFTQMKLATSLILIGLTMAVVGCESKYGSELNDLKKEAEAWREEQRTEFCNPTALAKRNEQKKQDAKDFYEELRKRWESGDPSLSSADRKFASSPFDYRKYGALETVEQCNNMFMGK